MTRVWTQDRYSVQTGKSKRITWQTDELERRVHVSIQLISLLQVKVKASLRNAVRHFELSLHL